MLRCTDPSTRKLCPGATRRLCPFRFAMGSEQRSALLKRRYVVSVWAASLAFNPWLNQLSVCGSGALGLLRMSAMSHFGWYSQVAQSRGVELSAAVNLTCLTRPPESLPLQHQGTPRLLLVCACDDYITVLFNVTDFSTSGLQIPHEHVDLSADQLCSRRRNIQKRTSRTYHIYYRLHSFIFLQCFSKHSASYLRPNHAFGVLPEYVALFIKKISFTKVPYSSYHGFHHASDSGWQRYSGNECERRCR